MLEQAIIDAEALRGAALKNAQTLVLEKYSSQIKDAVESLLEQENPLLAAGPDDDLSALADPAQSMGGASAAETSILEQIPLAVTSDSKSNEYDEVELSLDELLQEIKVMNESLTSDTLEEVEDLEEDLEEGHCGKRDGDDGDDKRLEEELEEDLDESFEIDEDLFEEDADTLQEKLVVDLSGPQKYGWGGMPESLIKLAEEELLAIQQDTEVKERNTAIRNAVKKLGAVNEALKSENTVLRESTDKAKGQLSKLMSAIHTLRENLEVSNLRNAKLLYQNKALTSNSLNERQKQNLVESVSNAETIEEAKIIFETLLNTVGSTSRKSQPKSLSEAVEKTSSIILTAGRNDTSQQKKTDPTLNRWKFLAGIDK
tara:strand:+ start:957 stop:2072 length:1116 start_codon:yes stop_codon:yes gene_type:complete